MSRIDLFELADGVAYRLEEIGVPRRQLAIRVQEAGKTEHEPALALVVVQGETDLVVRSAIVAEYGAPVRCAPYSRDAEWMHAGWDVGGGVTLAVNLWRQR